MKIYIGTKRISAEPMTRGRYNEFRGWQIPADENPNDEGYLVEYDNGYKSWSPKDVFEAAYCSVDDANLQIEKAFTYHPPKPGQPEKYTKLRETAKTFALLIDVNCPNSRGKSLAMTKLEECVMWANASIARWDGEQDE